MLVNRSELADVLGVSQVTVDNYSRAGMPYVQRPNAKNNRQWRFDTVTCIQWIVKRETPSSDKSKKGKVDLRLAEAETTLKEIQVAEKQALLINIHDVADEVEERLSIIKSRMNALPGRVAQAVAVETRPAEVLRMLKAEVADALDELSQGANDRLAKAAPALAAPARVVDPDVPVPVPTRTDSIAHDEPLPGDAAQATDWWDE